MKVYLLYGTQLVATLDSRDIAGQFIQKQFGQEIYDGGYLFVPTMTKTWWRCDSTPVLIDDAPKELRALALLLT